MTPGKNRLYEKSQSSTARSAKGSDSCLASPPLMESDKNEQSGCNYGHEGVASIDVHAAVAANEPTAPAECCLDIASFFSGRVTLSDHTKLSLLKHASLMRVCQCQVMCIKIKAVRMVLEEGIAIASGSTNFPLYHFQNHKKVFFAFCVYFFQWPRALVVMH